MINLHVHFKDDPSDGGTANLTENLITNEAHLYICKQLCLDEVKTFIDKATELLKKRFNIVNVTIHWEGV